MTNIDPHKLGNEIDAVAKKKYSVTLPIWVIVAIPVVSNILGWMHVI